MELNTFGLRMIVSLSKNQISHLNCSCKLELFDTLIKSMMMMMMMMMMIDDEIESYEDLEAFERSLGL